MLLALSSLNACTPLVSGYQLDSHKSITLYISESVRIDDKSLSSAQQSDSISSTRVNQDTQSLPTDSYQSTLVVIKQNSNTQTTLDSILNLDRIRFNGRSFVFDKISDEQTGKLSVLDDKKWVQEPVQTGTANMPQDTILMRPSLLQFFVLIHYPYTYHTIQNEITTADDANHAKNTALVLLVPLASFVLVRQGGVRPSSKFLSFFVLIVFFLPLRVKWNWFVSHWYEFLDVRGAWLVVACI